MLQEAKRAAAAWMAGYMERRAMWCEMQGDHVDIVPWLEDSDEHWVSGYVDNALGLRRHLYGDPDEQESYDHGWQCFDGATGAMSANIMTACNLAGLRVSDYASNPEKAVALC